MGSEDTYHDGASKMNPPSRGTVMAEEKKALSPAYVSYATLKNTLARLGEHELPPVIDNSLLGSMGGSTQAQFLGALRFLDLIDDKFRPSSLLKRLAAADENTWKALMVDLLAAKYPKQLAALKDGTPNSFKDSFESDASIVTPAARFLLMAAKDAGLPVSPHIVKVGISSGRTSSKRKAGNNGSGGGAATITPPTHPNPATSFRDKLLEKFPPFDPEWGEEQQKAWFTAYERLLSLDQQGQGAPLK